MVDDIHARFIAKIVLIYDTVLRFYVLSNGIKT